MTLFRNCALEQFVHLKCFIILFLPVMYLGCGSTAALILFISGPSAADRNVRRNRGLLKRTNLAGVLKKRMVASEAGMPKLCVTLIFCQPRRFFLKIKSYFALNHWIQIRE